MSEFENGGFVQQNVVASLRIVFWVPTIVFISFFTISDTVPHSLFAKGG
jgi:hypothetical protein